MNLKEAAQQALEAMELHLQWHESGCVYLEPAVTSIRAALAEDAMQRLTDEPVAWMWDYKRLDGHVEIKIAFAHRYKGFPGDLAYVLEGKDATPLYTAPPKRKPLTDDEIENCIDESFEYGLDRGNISNKSVIRFARALERAHGIGDEE